MRSCPLLAAALILAPLSARADDGAVHGKAVHAVGGCKDDKDQKTLEDAIERAAKKIESCMGSLNKGLAEKVLKAYGTFSYKCGYESSFEGGDTTFPGGKPTIKMAFVTSGRQYDFEARLFHEMIHGVDPKFQLVNTSAHSRAGATDPVYGCQLACYPGGIEAQEIKMSQSAGDVPDAKGYDPKKWMDSDSAYLMDDSEHRFAADIYAGICQGGKPTAARKSIDKNCLANKILAACPGAVDRSGCSDAAQQRSASCELLCDEKDPGAQVSAAQEAAASIKSALSDKTPLKGVVAGVFKQMTANKSLNACNK